jgi:hypothetical protein
MSRRPEDNWLAARCGTLCEPENGREVFWVCRRPRYHALPVYVVRGSGSVRNLRETRYRCQCAAVLASANTLLIAIAARLMP